MIYTDRKFNKMQKLTREEKIKRFEEELTDLERKLFDDTSLCNPENSALIHWLASQIEIMKSNK